MTRTTRNGICNFASARGRVASGHDSVRPIWVQLTLTRADLLSGGIYDAHYLFLLGPTWPDTWPLLLQMTMAFLQG